MPNIDYLLSLWSVQITLVLVLTVACHYLINILSTRLSHQFTGYLLVQALVRAMRIPGLVLIWLMAIFIVVELLDTHSTVCLADGVLWLRAPLIIAVISWCALRLNTEYFALCAERRRHSENQSETHDNLWELARKSVAVAIVAVATLMALPLLGLNIDGLLTLGGVGGIVVGFAARDLLSSMFRGVLLHVDQMFETGEYVRLADKGIEGVVEQVGWLKTTLRTPDQTLLYLPNTVFDNVVLENVDRGAGRRFYSKLPLRIQDMPRIPPLSEEIESYLASHKEVLKKSIIVGCTGVTAFAAELEIQALTSARKYKNFVRLEQELLLAIMAIIQRHGAKISEPEGKGKLA